MRVSHLKKYIYKETPQITCMLLNNRTLLCVVCTGWCMTSVFSQFATFLPDFNSLTPPNSFHSHKPSCDKNKLQHRPSVSY